MQVLFRVDAGRQIGYGHVYRCLVLADELARQGHESYFVTRRHDGHLADTILERGHDVILLPLQVQAEQGPDTWLGDEQERDARTTSLIAEEKKISVIIVDHYAADLQWTTATRRLGYPLLVIDDLANRRLMCDVLVNQNLNAKDHTYARLVGEKSKLLLGAKYALLAPPFAHARAIRSQSPRRQSGKRRIVIAMGGSDPTNATTSVLESLQHLREHAVHSDVIIGNTHPCAECVQDQASTFMSSRVHIQVPPSTVANLLARADIAIGAGGSSALERLCVGVPSIICEVADNQRSTVRSLSDARLALPYRLGFDSAGHLVSLVNRLLDDELLRTDIQVRGQRLVDGNGARRVAATVNDMTVGNTREDRL